MKTKTLKELEQLLDLKFRKKQFRYAKVLSHESRLREQLQRLDDQAKEAQKSKDHKLRAIGADVIWKSWLDRTKRTLNMELAQVLAQKEGLKSGVRREYGKLLVGRELLVNQQMDEKKEHQKQALSKTVDDHVNGAVWGSSFKKN